MAAEQIPSVWHRVNPAFLLMGEELFLAPDRELGRAPAAALPCVAVISRSVAGCSVVSRAVDREVADALTPGFWAFKGRSSGSSPDLLQVSTDGLSVWIKHTKYCKYN